MGSKAAVVLTLFLFAIGAGTATGADAPLPCARLLTASELREAAGPGWKALGQEEPEAGNSECTWLLESGANPKAVLLTYWKKSAIGAADLPGFFELQAKRAETAHGNGREVLEGIGARAALVPGKKPGAMAVLILQTADGVAYVETDDLERPQLLRLARAVAEP